MTHDHEVAPETMHYPPADIAPHEFECFVVELMRSIEPSIADLEVRLHDKIEGVDGVYDFDATVRFSFGGMDILILVEAKRHKNTIKRELVQVLHAKLRSVGAHKAVMISTAPFQRGALAYAKTNGIALVRVTEGRHTFEMRSFDHRPSLSREEAASAYGLPTFVGIAFGPGSSPSAAAMTVLDASEPRYVAEALFGLTLDATERYFGMGS